MSFLIRPIETHDVLKNYKSYSVDWFISYFLSYNDDEDCRFIQEHLPQEFKDQIDLEVQRRRADIQKQRADIQKQRADIQKQRDVIHVEIRAAEELNDMVLRKLDATRELKRQLGIQN